MKKLIQNIGRQMKYPAIYAGAFSGLTGVIEGVKSTINEGVVEGLETAAKTSLSNLPFFALVNTFYAKGIDVVAKRFGRLGANILCLGVNAGFAGYAYMFGDNDPSYQALATTAVGLYLTNNQVTDIQQKSK